MLYTPTMRPTLLLTALLLPATLHAQWEIQSAPTTASLRGIHALGNGIAWASGSSSTVLHTTDGGKNWQLCPTPPNAEKLDFRGIQAFDASTAIVMSSGKGDLSRLYKTTDACRTWTLLFTNPDPDGFFDAISARPSADQKSVDAMIAGDPVNGSFTLFELRIPMHSDDPPTLLPLPSFCPDKKPKLQLPLPVSPCIAKFFSSIGAGKHAGAKHFEIPEDQKSPVPRPGEALFAASNSSLYFDVWFSPNFGFVTGGPKGPRLIQYRGWSFCAGLGCESWRVADLPLSASDSSGAFSIAHKTGAILNIVGGDYLKPDVSAGTAAYTSDAGDHWAVAQTPPHGYRSSVAYSPATKTWVTVGPNGTDISTDDGRNWRALHPTPTEPPDADRNWNALSLPFVVGPHGRIGKLRPSALTQAGPAKP
jgi:hypothetical protein